MADYPAAITSFPTLVDNVDNALASHQNLRGAEIVAIETELGINVADPAVDLVTRLARILAEAQNIETQTLAGNLSLTDANKAIQKIDCNGAARNVTLPASATANHTYFIYNSSAGAFAITLKLPDTTTLTTINQGKAVLVFPIGSGVWKIIGLDSIPYVAPGTIGNVLTSDGAGNWASSAPAGSTGPISIVEGRLTLTSGSPVTTGDVTGATTIYFSPYRGNRISLFDGSSTWSVLTFTELSLALGILTSGLPYDVFAYNNSGTVAIEMLAWTNATTRATALTTQNGVLVKSGATTRRYIGTFCTTSTTTTEDSAARRYVWNYYNRIHKTLNCKDTTNSWAYVTAAYREVNGGSTYGTSRVGLMIGWSEDLVSAHALHVATASAGNPATATGIGLDSATNVALANQQIITSTTGYPTAAAWKGYPGVGQHYLAHLEYGAANVTFYGDNGALIFQTGLVADCFC